MNNMMGYDCVYLYIEKMINDREASHKASNSCFISTLENHKAHQLHTKFLKAFIETFPIDSEFKDKNIEKLIKSFNQKIN